MCNKLTPIVAAFSLFSVSLRAAEPLRFTSGSVSNTTVTLTLTGEPSLACQLERLNPTNNTWAVNTNFTTSTNGVSTLYSSLIDGYGYYRAKSTNGVYLSTNAFGAMRFEIPHSYSIIGNPFQPANVSTFFPNPPEGLSIQRYTNGTWDNVAGYDLGEWGYDPVLERGEAAMVFSPSTNAVALFCGTFDTNSFSRALPTGWSLIIPPLYRIQNFSLWSIDALTNGNPAGSSNFPFQSLSNPKMFLSFIKTPVGPTYYTYKYTTNNIWQLDGTNVADVPIVWSEGFWFNNAGTNSLNWMINSIPIW